VSVTENHLRSITNHHDHDHYYYYYYYYYYLILQFDNHVLRPSAEDTSCFGFILVQWEQLLLVPFMERKYSARKKER